jgi:hypothetical protein
VDWQQIEGSQEARVQEDGKRRGAEKEEEEEPKLKTLILNQNPNLPPNP